MKETDEGIPLAMSIEKIKSGGMRTTVVDLESGAQLVFEILEPKERQAFRLLAAAFKGTFIEKLNDTLEGMFNGTD